MRLFRQKVRPLSARQEVIAGRIANGLLSGQRRLADYLNAKTAHLSGKVRLWLLLLFGIAFGCYCLYLMVSPWN